MGISEVVAPAGDMFGNALVGVGKYWWILVPVVVILTVIGGVVILHFFKKKKAQWTHRLRIRRVLQNNLISDPVFIKMRRFPLIKKAEVFELEEPLLGGYLFPDVGEYSAANEFSIILDKDNRIYINKGDFWDPDKKSVKVSGRHGEIDLGRAKLKDDWQKMHKAGDRVTWATIAKYAVLFTLIIAASIILIVGLSKWSESHDARAAQETAKAQAMEDLAEAMHTVEDVANINKLLIPELKELKGTENLQALIRANSTG